MASVTKRRWTKPDGTVGEAWAVRYLDRQTGKRPAKTFTLKKDADAFAKKVEREIEDGLYVSAAASKRISEIIKEYLIDADIRRRDGRIGESHARRQEMVCKAYLIPAIGNITAKDLAMSDVASIYQNMVRKGLHPRSAKQYLSVLQQLEHFARKRGYIKTQPVSDAMSDLRGIPPFRIETFKPDEVAKLMVAAPAARRGRPLRTAAFIGCAVGLAALCGLRAGEILGLHSDSVDLDARIIRVRHNLTAYREVKGPKTAAGVRNVPIPAPVIAVLQNWRDNFEQPNSTGFMFTTSGRTAFTYGAMHMAWRRLLEREALATRHFHALRHFYASWLLRHGMPVADVSKMIGHSSHSLTLKVYTHSLLDDDEAVSRVDQIAAMLPAS